MTVGRLGTTLATVRADDTLLATCGSDDATSSTPAATEATYVTVPAAQVSAGLAATQVAMDTLAAASASADAAAVQGVNDSWLVYEGNIRIDDAQAYLGAEDALALFTRTAGTADGAGMAAAAGKFGTDGCGLHDGASGMSERSEGIISYGVSERSDERIPTPAKEASR